MPAWLLGSLLAGIKHPSAALSGQIPGARRKRKTGGHSMEYDFNKVTDRRGTNCLKYDFAKERGKREDVLPLWVADMDFQTAPCILER